MGEVEEEGDVASVVAYDGENKKVRRFLSSFH